jgi:hypothetical protein
VGVGEHVKELPRFVIVRERVREIGWRDDLAWHGVERDVYVDFVARGDPGGGAILRAERDEERPARIEV